MMKRNPPVRMPAAPVNYPTLPKPSKVSLHACMRARSDGLLQSRNNSQDSSAARI